MVVEAKQRFSTFRYPDRVLHTIRIGDRNRYLPDYDLENRRRRPSECLSTAFWRKISEAFTNGSYTIRPTGGVNHYTAQIYLTEARHSVDYAPVSQAGLLGYILATRGPKSPGLLSWLRMRDPNWNFRPRSDSPLESPARQGAQDARPRKFPGPEGESRFLSQDPWFQAYNVPPWWLHSFNSVFPRW